MCNSTSSIATLKLQDAISKIRILECEIQLFESNDVLKMVADIRNNVFSDVDIKNDLRNTVELSTCHKEFIENYSRLLNYLKCQYFDGDESAFAISYFSIIHDRNYNSVTELFTNNTECECYHFYDISILLSLTNLLDDSTVNICDRTLLELYQDVWYDRIEVLLTSSRFLNQNSSVESELSHKLLAGLKSDFSIQKYTSYYKTLTEPFSVKSQIREDALWTLHNIEGDLTINIHKKLSDFISSQIQICCDDLSFVFQSRIEYPKEINSFIESKFARNNCFWRIDLFIIAENYSDIVSERCNLFAHSNIDDNAGFFRTVFEGYASVTMSLLENLSAEGRRSIENDVFKVMDRVVNDCVHRSFEALSFSDCKRFKKIENDNTSSGLCYITTAVCRNTNKGDNCYELNTLRWFRDNWLKHQSYGDYYIQLYYKSAPIILAALNSDPAKDGIFQELNTIICSAVGYIETKNYDRAFLIYSSMVNSLCCYYGIDKII